MVQLNLEKTSLKLWRRIVEAEVEENMSILVRESCIAFLFLIYPQLEHTKYVAHKADCSIIEIIHGYVPESDKPHIW